MDLSNLSIQAALNNKWEEAILLNSQILNQNPDNIDALNRLGQAYLQLNNFQKAKEIYLQVLNLDKYNPIAKRNLNKIKCLCQNNLVNTARVVQKFNFIEEPGKAKVIYLVQLGEPTILSTLQTCLELSIQIRSQSVCLYYQNYYVGRLPDDIGFRLIWLLKHHNKYAAYIRSVDKNKVTVFIKEIKRSKKTKITTVLL